MKNLYKILIVDDEADYRETLSILFEAAGYETCAVSSAEEALSVLGREHFPLVVTDIMMENIDGIEFLSLLKKRYADEIEVIMVTGYGSVETAVETMKMGAFGYFIKGHDPAELLMELKKASGILDAKKQCGAKIGGNEPYILTSRNPEMKKVWETVGKIADTNANVLLLGESGTGKEIVANRIHMLSSRRNRPFVAINCRSYPDNLLESELFGHEKGAFTGAASRRIGKLEEGNGGTVFFDEIGDMSFESQIKLLRTLESRRIERLGSGRQIDVDVRIVSATHRDIYKMAAEDLEDFISYFTDKFAKETGRTICGIEPETKKWLMDYDYPGNIRELKNIIERLVILSDADGILKKEGMGDTAAVSFCEGTENAPIADYRQAKLDFDKHYIADALARNGYNITKTAQQIGLSRRQLFNKIKELEIPLDRQ